MPATTEMSRSTHCSGGEARGHAAPSPPGRVPRAILVSGAAAAGKTTLATALASTLHYAIADLDTITAPLVSAALTIAGDEPQDLDSPAARHLRQARYQALLDVACQNLRTGLGVVLAAPFTEESHDEDRWSALAASLTEAAGEGDVALLHLDAPAEVRRRRMAQRGAARDRVKLRRSPEDPGAETLVGTAIVLDGTAPVQGQLESALAALAKNGSPARATSKKRC